ncbi:hypothetical protein GQ457_08G034440 [Hibiscus cannabinus]
MCAMMVSEMMLHVNRVRDEQSSWGTIRSKSSATCEGSSSYGGTTKFDSELGASRGTLEVQRSIKQAHLRQAMRALSDLVRKNVTARKLEIKTQAQQALQEVLYTILGLSRRSLELARSFEWIEGLYPWNNGNTPCEHERYFP